MDWPKATSTHWPWPLDVRFVSTPSINFPSRSRRPQLKIEQARQKHDTSTAAIRAKATSELQMAEKQIADVQKKLAVAKEQFDTIQSSTLRSVHSIRNQYRPPPSPLRGGSLVEVIRSPRESRQSRLLRHFDTPLLERAFDFGLRSEKPRHAGLLDWLAVQFMEDDWSLKKLHKRIVMSGIYRLSSSSAQHRSRHERLIPTTIRCGE